MQPCRQRRSVVRVSTSALVVAKEDTYEQTLNDEYPTPSLQPPTRTYFRETASKKTAECAR